MSEGRDARQRWLVLATMTGALSMIMIDQTVVSVALPTMQHDLGLSQAGVQWVVNAYMLVLAMLVALGGRVADLLGPERVFRVGAATFVAASAACGLAQGEIGIIAARGVQGAGAALMVPATGSIVMNAFPLRERGRAMGIYSGVSMIFLALGPLIGGLLTEGVSWRAVFFVNLPVGVAMLAAAHVTLAHERVAAEDRGTVDWVGIPLLVGALGALVLALMEGRAWGWSSPPVVVLLAACALLAPAFVWWERRQRDPLVQLGLFRVGNFGIDASILAAVQFALVGVSVFGAIWVQDVLGYGPIEAGVSLLPLTLPLLVVAPLAGRLYDRSGPRGPLTAGSLLIALALGWMALVLHERDYAWLVPGYLAMGCGLGFAISPASTDSMAVAAPEQRSQASGLVQTTRQVGGVIGIAVLGAIIAGVEHAHAGAGTPAALRAADTTAVATAYWVGAGVMAVVTVAAARFVRRPAASAADASEAIAEPVA